MAILIGNGSSNTITGTSGADGISAGDGNDLIFAKGGIDIIDGGAGIDISFYQGKVVDYIYSLILGVFTVTDKNLSRDGIDALFNVEYLNFDATSAVVSNASLYRLVIGNNNANTLNGDGVNAMTNKDLMVGFDSNDTFNMGKGLDVAYGGGGNDTFNTSVGLNSAADNSSAASKLGYALIDGGSGSGDKVVITVTDTLYRTGGLADLKAEFDKTTTNKAVEFNFAALKLHVVNVEQVTFNIINTNQAPVIIAPSEPLNINEASLGAKALLGIAPVTISASDDGSIASVTLSDNRFEIANGVLKLKNDVALDYDDPAQPKSFDITVTATDNLGLSSSVVLHINLNNINDTAGTTFNNFAVTGTVQIGSDAADTLVGTDADDYLVGGDGNDNISTRLGVDVVRAGRGDDRINVGADEGALPYNTLEVGKFIDGGVGIDTLAFAREASEYSFTYVDPNNPQAQPIFDMLFGSAAPVGTTAFIMFNPVDLGTAVLGTGPNTWSAEIIEFNGVGYRLVTAAGDVSSTLNAVADPALLNRNLLVGFNGDDQLFGGAGNDILIGGAGTNQMTGAQGNDTYIVSSSSDIIFETSTGGFDVVKSNVSFELRVNVEELDLLGSANIDATGNAGANFLKGNSGNNTLDGRGGNDIIDGGDGIDTAVYQGNANDYTFTWLSTTSFSINDTLGRDGTDTLSNIEILKIAGVDYSLRIGTNLAELLVGDLQGTVTASINTDSQILLGFDGDDTLVGDIYSSSAQDSYGIQLVNLSANIFTFGADILDGGVGNDTLVGDIYSGSSNNSGNDSYGIFLNPSNNNTFTFGDDHLNGGAGNDTLVGDIDTVATLGNIRGIFGSNSDNNTFTFGNDQLDGGSDNDILVGDISSVSTGITMQISSNNNTFSFGADQLNGGAGNDTLVGDVYVTFSLQAVGINLASTTTNNNTITFGNDVLDGSDGDDLLVGDIYTSGENSRGINFGTATGNTINLGNDHLIGGNGNDTLVGDILASTVLSGNVANNTITGGNDVLEGGAGNDSLTGGFGNDTLDGGADIDTAVYTGALSNYSLTMDVNGLLTVTDSVGNRDGVDTLSNIEQLQFADGLFNLVLGSDGDEDGISNPQLLGTAGRDIILGFAGNDTLNGDAGDDIMVGGAGDDTYVVDNAGDVVTENAAEGTDTVQSSVDYTLGANVENLTLLAGAGNINAIGNELSNVITGNEGNNTLDGGAGIDTAVYTGAATDYRFSFNALNNFNINDSAPGRDGTDTIKNFEKLIFSGVEYQLIAGDNANNTLQAVTSPFIGVKINNILLGFDGDDTLISSNNSTGQNILMGGAGNDTYSILGSNSQVVENANEGIDTIQVKGNNYTLGANIENGVLISEFGTLIGNELDNVLSSDTAGGNASNYTLFGLDGNDTLIGNNSGDILDGGNGNDTLDGGNDADLMRGGDGNDTYYTNTSSDVVIENANEGIDTVLSYSDFALTANVENLTLIEGSAATLGFGNELANIIIGNSGNNSLYGGAGDDTLDGGAGIDTAVFSGSADQYRFAIVSPGVLSVTDSAPGRDGSDRISNVEQVQFNGTTYHLVLQTAVFGVPQNLSGFDDPALDYSDLLLGLSGNVTLDGGLGADIMVGGIGNNVFRVDNAGDQVIENALVNQGTDRVESFVDYTLGTNLENLTLLGSAVNGTGNALDNIIIGNSAANTLVGGDGNDTLDGQGGVDSMSGGAGDDTYVVDNTGDVVTENADEGIDTVLSFISYNLGDNVENLTLLENINANNAIGNSGDNIITGNSFNNFLNGLGGTDTAVYQGNASAYTFTWEDSITFAIQDSVSGRDGRDRLANFEKLRFADGDYELRMGTSGDDVFNVTAANEVLLGGTGNDTYLVDNAVDVLSENANEGIDTVQSTISYTLGANLENLTLLAGAGNINATGNNQNNILTGNEGNNTLDGGAGTDTAVFTGNVNQYSFVIVSPGVLSVTDSAPGRDGSDRISNVEQVQFNGTTYHLVLQTAVFGVPQNLSGFNDPALNNRDLLLGLSGNVTLDGGLGADIMVGGIGNNVFRVDNAGDQVIENAFVNQGTDRVESSVDYTLGTNIENLTLLGSAVSGTGNALSNIIIGNSAANTLVGGDGNDTLDGQGGTDTMIGGAGDDTYVVDNTGDVVTENANEGIDTVLSSLATYTLRATVENLTLLGTGQFGIGNALDNIITGNSSDNILEGQTGTDTAVFQGSANEYSFSNGAFDTQIVINDSVSGRDGTDSVSNFEVIRFAGVDYGLRLGTSGNDSLIATAANEFIFGRAGNDTLSGGAGNDILDGGDGIDTAVFSGTADQYRFAIVSPGVLSVTDSAPSRDGVDTLSNIENLTFAGVNIGLRIGTNGDDSLNGAAGNDVLIGGAGNDILDGFLGSDIMIGGTGDDLYFVDNTGDVITENINEGKDIVISSVDFTLGANVEDLFLNNQTNINATGNELDNNLFGNGGNNIFDGRAGADTMTGGFGDDTYFVDNIADVVIEEGDVSSANGLLSQGNDTVKSSIDYTLGANVENLTLIEGSAALNGTGNALNNVITGNSGNNILNGAGGNDTLISNGGNDTLTGGAGADHFVIDMVKNNGNTLHVQDFLLSAGDVIDISSYVGPNNNPLINTVISNDLVSSIIIQDFGQHTVTLDFSNSPLAQFVSTNFVHIL